MPNSFFEQWSKGNKFMQPFLELSSMNARFIGDMARKNLMFMNDMMKSSAEQFQDMGQIKGMNDFFELQSNITKKTMPTFINHTEEMIEILLNSAQMYNEWFEKEWNDFAQTSRESVQKMQKGMKGSSSEK